MVAVRSMFVLVKRKTLGDSMLVLQTGQLSTTMIVPRAVLIVIQEAPQERLVKHCVLGDVAGIPLVEWKADVLPSVKFQLPALDDG